MRTALPALLLAVVLVTAGCQTVLGPDRPPSDERARDAVERADRALADADAYRFTVSGRVHASQGEESRTIDVDGEGAVDLATRRMNVTTRTGDGALSTFVDGTTAYSECPDPWGGWGRENLTGSAAWRNRTPAGEQIALLSRTDVYWRGIERVDGTEAAVVVAYPTKKELRAGAEARGDGTEGLASTTVENVTVTVWLSEATGRPLKARREIELRRQGATATARLTFRFSDYGDPVNVTRPPLEEDEVWSLGCPGD